MAQLALIGAQVFDGQTLRKGLAVLIRDGVPKTVAPSALPSGCATVPLNGGILLPGFVDLQVNGGGGIMFGDMPTPEGLATLATAHRTLGTTALLPTLITDRPEVTRAAIDAVANAVAQGVPGVLGLHLEGPHLDPRRAGAHDTARIRPMTDDDLGVLLRAAQRIPNLMVTLAPEAVRPDQIQKLCKAGVVVSLGHSDTDYESARAVIAAGACCVTHLFNAMSPLASRAPGLVGAALQSNVAAGLIADGIHVHPATISTALAARSARAATFLISDAMACAGTEQTEFMLQGRRIMRAHGRLTLPDGTLAGADLDLARAVHVMVEAVGEPLETALARATRIPASVLPEPGDAGHWPDSMERLNYLTPKFKVVPATTLLG